MAINLTEFNKAEKMLKDRGIDFERGDQTKEYESGTFERHIIGNCLGNGKKWLWDFVCSIGTYGSEEGLLEYWSKNLKDRGEDPKGWLTAEEVVELIEQGV